MKPPAFILLATVPLLVASSVMFPGHPFVMINHTPSLPEGIYTVSYGNRMVARNDIVLVCLPDSLALTARRRGYIGYGSCNNGSEIVMKRVAAVVGDVVDTDASGISVNGQLLPGTATMENDSAGRQMIPYPYGRHTVPLGMVWLTTPNPHSFDSRYFGPLHESFIIGHGSPLLVWSSL